jgi:hypothetical protein
MSLLSTDAPDARSQRAHDLPSGPPPEVLDEIDAAWERARVPGPVELWFVSEPGLRAWGELRLPGGERLTSIAASEAIAIACGE